MIKRNFLVGLCVFFLGVSTSTYAGDTEVVLDTNDSTSGFTVKDSDNLSLMRVGGDGSVSVNGNLQIKLPFQSGIDAFKITIGATDKFLIDGEGIIRTPIKVGVTGFKTNTNGDIEVNTIKFKDNLAGTFGNIFYLNARSYPFGWNGMEIKKQPGSPGKLLRISSDIATGDFLTVDGAGNVGIGTASPAGKLDVNGTIFQRGSSLHSDYVFDSNYELESIAEHAKFMWKNKHLTAIPKAKKDESGLEVIEVGAHRKGIVEELEKAHIYIEQLHGHNKELEERLAKLEARLNGGI